jgi:type III secretion system low calcium response chaperone LcrH/SycD
MTVTENNSSAQLPKMFDKNPELKKKLQDFLANVTEEEKQRSVKMIDRFMRGEITWAEVKNVPQNLLKFLATVAYQSFKSGDLKKAEILFKGLAIMDHKNWYYRAGLGAVYQKQGLYEEAAEEFGFALKLNPEEVTSLVNRGQCHLRLGDREAALEDFERVKTLKIDRNNPWLKRAEMLIQAVAKTGEEG